MCLLSYSYAVCTQPHLSQNPLHFTFHTCPTMACIHISLCLLLHLLHFTAHGVDMAEKDSSTPQLNANEPYGPQSLTILGPGAVTVGVPCSYICIADCSPTCNYTIGIDDQTGEGNEVDFTLSQWVKSKIVTCTAKNPVTGNSSTARKTLRILEGPVDVLISGPQTLTPGKTQRFLCSATCKPSCTYTWVVDGDSVPGSGDEVAITAPLEATSGTIICKATNTVSGLFVTAIQKLNATKSYRSTAERVELLPTLVFASVIQFGIMFTL
ncbi:uncharacterized protein LOC113532409 [Pangasianodon hypophthalmus]|uniref:uncharacterized protein LOC113532409 n=1 Tax=Pangasianodon hypophthalmus TaxID=310915 RepID=UPI002307E8FC|nr:uncharacterized protein LOC113532409 [Pangasianodon hypophthalmus]